MTAPEQAIGVDDVTGPEKLIFDHYVIEKVLGRGAMGTVYLARDMRIGRKAALKTLHARHQQFDNQQSAFEFLERFRREAELCGSLVHPNITTLYEVGYESKRITYLSIEYVEGESLASMIRREGKLKVDAAFNLADEVLQGLAYAHERGIIHRDIKPANILVNMEGHAKITDFGIARSAQSNLTNLTVAGQLLGTPHYMAPEHVAGRGIDARSDLFSLGVVLFEMLTGTKPFEGSDLTDVLYNVVHQPSPRLSTVAPDLPRWCAIFVEHLIEKSPNDRFLSASAASRELKRLMTVHQSMFETSAGGKSEIPVSRERTPEDTPTTPISSSDVRRRPSASPLQKEIPSRWAVAIISTLLILLSGAVWTLQTRSNLALVDPISARERALFESRKVKLAEARLLLANGAYSESIKRFDSYLRENPSSPAAIKGKKDAEAALRKATQRPKAKATRTKSRRKKPSARRSSPTTRRVPR